DQRAAPPPLRGEPRAARRAVARRPGLLGRLARRPPGGGDRAARSPLVRGVPVPSRGQVAALRAAPSVRGLPGGGDRPAERRRPLAAGRACRLGGLPLLIRTSRTSGGAGR